MAEALLDKSVLRINYITGQKENGDPIVRAKSYNNVNPDATPEALLETAEALSSLQTEPLHSVWRNDTLMITESAEE